jgi:hypothetical protein
MAADVRCPDRGGLLYRITDDGLIEINCDRCRSAARRRDPHVQLVLHVFKPDDPTPVDTVEIRLEPRRQT